MLRLGSMVVAALLVACGGESGTDAGVDASAIPDGGAADAGRGDAGGPVDAGPTDAAVDASEPCGDFGRSCSGAGSCGGGYTCDTDRDRCLPTGRPICGGFAGASCPTDGAYTQCLYLQPADYGPCLTSAEEMCACMMHRDLFACP